MKTYKILGKEFASYEDAKHFLEVSIRLSSDPRKKVLYEHLLRRLKK
jgi:hypothetical protein